uniref:Protein-tyrosine-phosphatase n=1 Tax=Macrostomum lignano TaxID=282301 RepID=A0A1I8F2R3_9PLAT
IPDRRDPQPRRRRARHLLAGCWDRDPAGSRKISVDDNPQADIGQHFDAVADRINSEALNGRRVLVYCKAGVSRSATLVLAYLVKHAGLSLREAHSVCKRRRPFIRPNAGFWRQLCTFELSRRGEQSVKMVQSAEDGLIPDLYKDELASGSAGGLCWIALK